MDYATCGAALVCATGVLGFPHRALIVRGCLPYLRCRARPQLPSVTKLPAQHMSPHGVGSLVVRLRPNNPRRQRLEPLVVPPLRLGHLGALRQPQHVEGICRGLCPALRAH
eukprot:scaffold112803_cov57-Phaeocystis_antarctica.AAC.2